MLSQTMILPMYFHYIRCRSTNVVTSTANGVCIWKQTQYKPHAHKVIRNVYIFKMTDFAILCIIISPTRLCHLSWFVGWGLTVGRIAQKGEDEFSW